VSDGKLEKPQPKPVVERAPSLARKIADYQGDAVDDKRGMAAIHAHKQQYMRGVEYRFSDGEHGEPPLANLSAQRGQPVREFVGREQTSRAMRKAEGAPGEASIPKTTGSALPSDVRTKMEPQLGADLSSVKVHTGSASAKAATGFGARAFTVGSDVHFNSGEFAPGTKEGDKLLAHELTHVVQGQRSGVQRKAAEDSGAEEKEGVSQPHEPAEQEADEVSDKVADALHDEKADGKGEKKKGKGAAQKDDGEKGDEHKAEEKPAPISAKLDGVGRKVFLAKKPSATPSPAPATGAGAKPGGGGATPAASTDVPFAAFSGSVGGDEVKITGTGAKPELSIKGKPGASFLGDIVTGRLTTAKNGTGRQYVQSVEAAINNSAKALNAITITAGKIPKASEKTAETVGKDIVQQLTAMTQKMKIANLGRALEYKKMEPKVPAVVFNAPGVSENTEKYKTQFKNELIRQLTDQQNKLNAVSVDEFLFNTQKYRIFAETFSRLDSDARVQVIQERQAQLAKAQSVARGKSRVAMRNKAAAELERSRQENAAGNVDVPDSNILSPRNKQGRGRNIGAEGRVGDNRAISRPHEQSGGAQAVANAANNRGGPDPRLVKEFEDWSALVKSIDDLVVIHNPDQVAGGPGNVKGITPPPDVDEEKTNNSDVWINYVISLKQLYGPKVVNETIGKGWDTNINSLQSDINAAIPAESQALHQMDIELKPGPI